MKKKLLFAILICALILGVGAQDKKKETKKTPAKPVSLDEKLQQDMDPDVFVYDPQGRRDPFKNLLQGQEGAAKRGRGEGIEGLTIGELVLEGIVFTSGEYRAWVRGPDNTPYTLKVGDNVYNGRVTEINAGTVIFKQILTVALGGTKEKIVEKNLNPEEEAKKK